MPARAGKWTLAATDRAARTVVFKPAQLAADGPATPALRVLLQLESYGTGTCCLTRRLHHPSGLLVTAQTIGSQPAERLARLSSLAPQQQFRQGVAQVTALSYTYDTTPARKASAAPAQPWALQQGVVLTEVLQLTLKVSPVKGVAADITLAPRHGLALDLPADLLAVQVLGQPPAQFHSRWWLARWGVVLRRGIPTLTAAGLLGTALMLPRMDLGVAPKAWVLLHYLPIGLLALSFCLQELPRFEIPPLPRRSKAQGWFPALPGGRPGAVLAAE